LGVIGISRHPRNAVATAPTLISLLALGPLFLSLTGDYSQAVYALLFGEVLGISRSQILPAALLGIAAIGLIVLRF